MADRRRIRRLAQPARAGGGRAGRGGKARRTAARLSGLGRQSLANEVTDLFEPGAVSVVANARPDARHEEPAELRARMVGCSGRPSRSEDETHLSSIAFPRAIGALAARRACGSWASTSAPAPRFGRSASRTGPWRAGALRGRPGGYRACPGAAARVARLAGDAGEEAAVADLLQTLRARPATLPQTSEELSATHAAARLQLAGLLEESVAGTLDLVIGAGRTIAAAPHPAQAARMLLDGVRPVGITQLAVDAAAVLGPLGSLPDDEIREGLTLLGGDLIVPLGTAVVCRGGEQGRVAMRVTVHRSGWPTQAPIEVRTGQLHVVSLERGQEAEIIIEPAAGVSLGAARRSPRIEANVTGGPSGSCSTRAASRSRCRSVATTAARCSRGGATR